MFAVKLTCLMVISQGCVLGTCSRRIDARATLYCRGPGNRVASDPQCGFRMTEVYVDGSSVAKVPVELVFLWAPLLGAGAFLPPIAWPPSCQLQCHRNHLNCRCLCLSTTLSAQAPLDSTETENQTNHPSHQEYTILCRGDFVYSEFNLSQ